MRNEVAVADFNLLSQHFPKRTGDLSLASELRTGDCLVRCYAVRLPSVPDDNSGQPSLTALTPTNPVKYKMAGKRDYYWRRDCSS